MLNLIVKYLTKNRCYTNRSIIVPNGIMVHSLGVAQPNKDVIFNQWNDPNKKVSIHALVGRDSSYQTLPWNYKGWHAGGTANSSYIGFEICEPAGHKYNGGTMLNYNVQKNAEYFNDVYNNALELTMHILKMYPNIKTSNINLICHSEGYSKGIASNHADVMHWFPKHGKTMDIFRADIDNLRKKYAADRIYYDVYKINTKDGLNLRTAANTSGTVVTTLPKGTELYVINIENGWAHLECGYYCSATYLDLVSKKTATWTSTGSPSNGSSSGNSTDSSSGSDTATKPDDSNNTESKLDNDPDSYAEDAIVWAIKNKILQGDNHGDLKLHSNITRQDTVVIIKRLYDLLK